MIQISEEEQWNIVVRRFLYHSPNGMIEGFHVSSDKPNGRVIMFCRGGTRGLIGFIDDGLLSNFIFPLAKAGFTIYASQYSEGPHSEGKDEYGGKETNDVLALLDVMKQDGNFNPGDFLGLFGVSRGAMTGCLAIQNGLPVTTAAFVGGFYDATNIAEERPDIFEMWRRDKMFDVTNDALLSRSALYHAENMKRIPVLILHGTTDVKVNVRQAEAFKTALGSNAELVLFKDDNHPISNHSDERNKRLIDWFSK